jgi:hypothetical protein
MTCALSVHIGGDEFGPGAELAQLAGDGGAARRVALGDDHRGALAGETTRDAPPDALPRAGDDRDSLIQASHGRQEKHRRLPMNNSYAGPPGPPPPAGRRRACSRQSRTVE